MQKANTQPQQIDFQKAAETGQIVRGRVRMMQKGTYEGDEDMLIVEVAGRKVTVPRSEIELGVNQSLTHLVGVEIDLIITLAPAGVPLIFGSQKAVIAMEQKPIMDKLHKGEVIDGTIVNILPYGAYVSLSESGPNGLLKNVDFSDGINTVQDICRVGEKIPVKLLKISETGNIYLEAAKKYTTEDIFTIKDFVAKQVAYGTIVDVKTFGVFVRIAPNVDVLCPIPDFYDNIQEGQKAQVVIKTINEEENRVRGYIYKIID